MNCFELAAAVSCYGYVLHFSMISYVISVVMNHTTEEPFASLQNNTLNSTLQPDLGFDFGDDSTDTIAIFLETVEKYEQNKEKCVAGTQYNLGDGVIQQYGINRFKAQAMVAVNRANFLTMIWIEYDEYSPDSEYFLYTAVRSMLEGDPVLFAAGNCHDQGEFKDYYLFCPYSYRMPDGRINVKDLSVEYDYMGNDSEWFYAARMKASKLENFNYTNGK